jgi:hypothetical protein
MRRACERRDPKVQQLYQPLPGKENVFRFYVSMHEPSGMRGSKSRCNLSSDAERFARFERPATESVAQSFAFVSSHRDEASAVRRFSDLIDSRDIRMVERRRCLRFGDQSSACIRIERGTNREELECGNTPELSISRRIYDTHATTPELGDELEVADCIAGHEVVSYRRAGVDEMRDFFESVVEHVFASFIGGEHGANCCSELLVSARLSPEKTFAHIQRLLDEMLEDCDCEFPSSWIEWRTRNQNSSEGAYRVNFIVPSSTELYLTPIRSSA